MSGDAIVVRDLRKRYAKVEAVRGISFDVRAGTTTALLGGNGAGKTTTLSMLLGRPAADRGIDPRAGRATCCAHRYRVLPRMNFSSPYVDLPKRLTVRENLRVFADLYGVARPARTHRRARSEVDLGRLLKRPYGELSAGQRTRVALAKALLNEPEVLLLDEPTASLDPDIGDRCAAISKLYQRAQRLHDAARLAQHGRGRAAVRRRDHAARGQYRRPRLARGIDRALWPRHDGRGLPRHRARRIVETPRGDAAEEVVHDGSRHGSARSTERRRRVAAARAGAGAAPRVPAAAVVAAGRLDGVLPDGEDGAVGLHHALPRADRTASFVDAPGFFIGAVLLWDVLFRGQLGVSLAFMEEMYSRNLGNLFVSPLRPYEFIVGQLTMSVIRTLIGVGGACLFACRCSSYSIFSMGLPLLAFFACLLAFGWAIGLAVSAMILRCGSRRRGARVGGDLPGRAGVRRLLPDRRAARPHCRRSRYALPPAHVFEGMRSGASGSTRSAPTCCRNALLLDAVYVALGASIVRR